MSSTLLMKVFRKFVELIVDLTNYYAWWFDLVIRSSSLRLFRMVWTGLLSSCEKLRIKFSWLLMRFSISWSLTISFSLSFIWSWTYWYAKDTKVLKLSIWIKSSISLLIFCFKSSRDSKELISFWYNGINMETTATWVVIPNRDITILCLLVPRYYWFSTKGSVQK